MLFFGVIKVGFWMLLVFLCLYIRMFVRCWMLYHFFVLHGMVLESFDIYSFLVLLYLWFCVFLSFFFPDAFDGVLSFGLKKLTYFS